MEIPDFAELSECWPPCNKTGPHAVAYTRGYAVQWNQHGSPNIQSDISECI